MKSSRAGKYSNDNIPSKARQEAETCCFLVRPTNEVEKLNRNPSSLHGKVADSKPVFHKGAPVSAHGVGTTKLRKGFTISAI